jgi:integrase
MARKARALTAKRIERTTEPGRYRDAEVKGLYLQINPNGAKSWLLRYERAGRERWHGLGPADLVTLKAARERARAKRLLLLDGIDPIEHSKAERAKREAAQARVLTFAEAAEAYHRQHEPKWTNAKHAAQFMVSLRDYAFPHIGRLAVGEITTPDVLRAIEPIWMQKTETASRVRGRIEAVLDWTTVRGHRQGDNPARWKGHLDQVLPNRGDVAKVEHHPAMPYADVPGFVGALAERPGIAAPALRFLILTAARTREVVGAQWQEVDLAARTWVVPAGRMKGHREHRVPLSDAAVALLKALPTEQGNPHVFLGPRGGGGLSNMGMVALLRRMGRGEYTVHGFRSSFRDWAAERSNFANHIVEMALAHKIGDAVEAAYRRGDLFDKRRQLADAWARFCTAPAATGERVVPIGRRS